MVRRAEAALGADPRFEFAVVDAERPAALGPAAPFDLICSSFAAQWFAHLEDALAGLAQFLKPGGRMLVTTLAEGSFAQWRRAHAELGLASGVPAYPSVAALRDVRPAGLTGVVDVYEDVETFASGRQFLASLRSIGATTPLQDHVALRPGQIRQVLRRFEQLGGAVSYQVATLQYQA
jgi:malonyl-CoA O-methyltransferase